LIILFFTFHYLIIVFDVVWYFDLCFDLSRDSYDNGIVEIDPKPFRWPFRTRFSGLFGTPFFCACVTGGSPFRTWKYRASNRKIMYKPFMSSPPLHHRETCVGLDVSADFDNWSKSTISSDDSDVGFFTGFGANWNICYRLFNLWPNRTVLTVRRVRLSSSLYDISIFERVVCVFKTQYFIHS